MIKLKFLFLFILMNNFAFAQKQKLSQKDIKPLACVLVEKDSMSFWIDQTEVTNIQWQDFLASIKKNNPEMYKIMLPSNDVWEDKSIMAKMTNDSIIYILHELSPSLSDVAYGYGGSYLVDYFHYSGFRFFPVVGISHNQVQEFCKWRSKIVTKNFNLNKKSKRLKNYRVEFTYRLPTEKEWEISALGDTNDGYGFSSLNKDEKVKRKKYDIQYNKTFNFNKREKKYMMRTKYLSKANTSDYLKPKLIPNKIYMEASITDDVFAHFPNDFGLYNMIGNVAEMIQEKGISKGGSWIDKLENCTIKNRKTYYKANALTGFRCVCEVKLVKIEN